MPHTPAPWTIEEYGDDETPNLVIHKDSESRICFMATPGSHGDPAIIEANAKLIAAAPDLLDALRSAVASIKVNDTGEPISHALPWNVKWYADALAAITKAV